MSTVLTGATGYLGSYACHLLLEAGERVTCLIRARDPKHARERIWQSLSLPSVVPLPLLGVALPPTPSGPFLAAASISSTEAAVTFDWSEMFPKTSVDMRS